MVEIIYCRLVIDQNMRTMDVVVKSTSQKRDIPTQRERLTPVPNFRNRGEGKACLASARWNRYAQGVYARRVVENAPSASLERK